MALHGTIEVNGEPIGSWSARRVKDLPDGQSRYDCRVCCGRQDTRGEVLHRPEDGAVALARLVLGLALVTG